MATEEPPGLQAPPIADLRAWASWDNLPRTVLQPRHLGSPVTDLPLQEQRRRQAAGASGLPSPTSPRNGQFAPHVWIWSDLESGGNHTSQAGGQHTFDSSWGRGRREAPAGCSLCCRLPLGFLGKASQEKWERVPTPPCTPGFLLPGPCVCTLLPLLSRRGHSSACPRPCPPLGFAWLSSKRA